MSTADTDEDHTAAARLPRDLAAVVRPWHALFWLTLGLLIAAISSALLGEHTRAAAYRNDPELPPVTAFGAVGNDVVAVIGIVVAVLVAAYAIYRVERRVWPAPCVLGAIIPASYRILHLVEAPVAPRVRDAAVLLLLATTWIVAVTTSLHRRPASCDQGIGPT